MIAKSHHFAARKVACAKPNRLTKPLLLSINQLLCYVAGSFKESSGSWAALGGPRLVSMAKWKYPLVAG